MKGKCTTDHISPAGAWLRFRGHLENISENLLLGATNAFTGEIGRDQGVEIAKKARKWKENGQNWVIIGDENYGEGSSREHAAMSPRFLGCKVVMARSFARIHETNLKKQGILALTFANSNDYDRIGSGDRIQIIRPFSLSPSKVLLVKLLHLDGESSLIDANHSYNLEQIQWFIAGSALNFVREKK